MEEKKTLKSAAIVTVVLVAAIGFGSLFSSPTIELIKVIATPLTLWLIANRVTLKLAKQQDQATDERNKQESLKAYLDRMTTLLIDKNLSQQSFGSPEVRVAKALTLSLLRELDLERKKYLIDFLREAELIQYKSNENSPALFKGANLTGLDLSQIDLSEVDLEKANLGKAQLKGADLSYANLTEADLRYANLSDAILTGTKLINANLHKAKLSKAFCINADFDKATLLGADFNGEIIEARLDKADLSKADQEKESLELTNFKRTNLCGACLETDLSKVLLEGAKYDTYTIFPQGFDPEAKGMKEVE